MLTTNLVIMLVTCVTMFTQCGASNVYRTKGLSSHKMCGGIYCLFREATCMEQRCVCNSGNGLGAISCSKRGTTNGGIFSEPGDDPSASNYQTVHSPCRYLVAHIESDMIEKGEKKGVCDIKIHAFERRSKGKFYIAGTDLTVRMKTWEGQEKQESVRWLAGGRKGIYSWQVKPRVDYTIGWGKTQCMDLAVDGTNNRAKVIARLCGFNMAFRPLDTIYKKQTHLAGLNFDASHKHLPAWKSLDHAMLVPPPNSWGKVYSVLHLPIYANGTFMSRAMSGAVEQKFPGVPPSCAAVQQTANQCKADHGNATRAEAFAVCDFILDIKCWNKGDRTSNMEKVMKLFNQCMESICTKNESLCESVIGQVQKECQEELPEELDGFGCSQL